MSRLRDLVANTDDSHEELVDIPEWGIQLLMVSMSGRDRANLYGALEGLDGAESIARFYPDIIITCARDPESREIVFQADDEDMLNTKSSAVLERVATVALKVSGLTNEELSDAGNDSPAAASTVSSLS